MRALIIMFDFAMCALNAALFVAYGEPWSLGAAIFCGAMGFVLAIQESY